MCIKGGSDVCSCRTQFCEGCCSLMNKLEQHVYKVFIEEGFNLTASTFLLAVSGGCDSMAMLELCKTLQFKVAVAHCNFKLRDADSDADELLVKEYCRE